MARLPQHRRRLRRAAASAWPAPVGTIGEHVARRPGRRSSTSTATACPTSCAAAIPAPVRGPIRAASHRRPRTRPAWRSTSTPARDSARCEPPIPVPQGFGVQELGENGNVVQDLFDVNGDGLPDWIYRRYNAITLGYDPEWRVLLNRRRHARAGDLRAADVPAGALQRGDPGARVGRRQRVLPAQPGRRHRSSIWSM